MTDAIILLIHFSLTIGMVLSLIRLWIGPHISDRVVAFDLFAALVLGHLVVFFARTGIALFLDIAIVIALLAFIATVALARLIEQPTATEAKDA